LSRLMLRLDLESEAGMRYFLQLLADIGVYDALRKAGAADGDTVRGGDLEVEYVDCAPWWRARKAGKGSEQQACHPGQTPAYPPAQGLGGGLTAGIATCREKC